MYKENTNRKVYAHAFQNCVYLWLVKPTGIVVYNIFMQYWIIREKTSETLVND